MYLSIGAHIRPLMYWCYQELIDCRRRGHVASRNGEILIVTINRPLFSQNQLKKSIEPLTKLETNKY